MSLPKSNDQPVANGVKVGNNQTSLDLVNIPMPKVDTANTNSNVNADSTDGSAPLPPQPSIGDEAPVNNNLNSNSKEINSENSKTKVNITLSKSKSLTKLPMPPGVNVAELANAPTPSPPRSDDLDDESPIKPSFKLNTTNKTTNSLTTVPAAVANNNNSSSSLTTPTAAKKGLLNLPMPPMVPGSEELSGDEDIGSPSDFTKDTDKSIVNSSTKEKPKPKRPTILNRRSSRANVRDWGERCVDVFEVIAQIGEGTYGQVSLIVVIRAYTSLFKRFEHASNACF